MLSRMFTRVLPLPTDNWSDYSDMWFCHKPQSTKSHSDIGPECGGHLHSSTEPDDCLSGAERLLPYLCEGDCLVGHWYLLVHSSMLCQQSIGADPLSRQQPRHLICLRCRNFIGCVAPNGETAVMWCQASIPLMCQCCCFPLDHHCCCCCWVISGIWWLSSAWPEPCVRDQPTHQRFVQIIVDVSESSTFDFFNKSGVWWVKWKYFDPKYCSISISADSDHMGGHVLERRWFLEGGP